jgi:glycine/D-amino acid oxidase-like deaminating enzyme
MAVSEAIVIGAGIVGAACAAELAHAGLRVTLLEQAQPGTDATAAGMGHIVVMDDSPAQLALTQLSRQLWDTLATSLPDAVEFDRCGTVWIAQDEEEMAEVHRKHATYGAAGVETEILDAAGLHAAEPNLAADLAGGLRAPGDAVLYPPVAARVLVERAVADGAKFLAETSVASAQNHTVTLHDGSSLHAEFIVNAAGASAGQLTPGLPIRKRKGHLVITDRYPGFCRHQLVELGYLKSAHSVSADSVAFNLQPRRTGQMLLGSSRQFTGESSAVDVRIVHAMIARAERYTPNIGALSALRVWTGFRAATPDKLPLIGPSLDDASVWLATGHEGLGITTSLATARLLSDQILGRPSPIAIEPYLPARFQGKQEAAAHD